MYQTYNVQLCIKHTLQLLYQTYCTILGNRQNVRRKKFPKKVLIFRTKKSCGKKVLLLNVSGKSYQFDTLFSRTFFPGIQNTGLHFQWHFFTGLEKIRTFFQSFYFQVFFQKLFFPGLSYNDSCCTPYCC